MNDAPSYVSATDGAAPDPEQVRADLLALADELNPPDSIDRHPPLDPTLARQLRQLGNAIDTPQFEELSTLELRGTLDLSALEEQAFLHSQGRQLPRLRQLETARNSLVLFPIVLTWFSLAIAAFNYGVTVGLDNDKLQIPFLLMWQQGFQSAGTILPWLTFTHMAALDGILLFSIFAMTIILEHHRNSVTATAVEAATRLRDRVQAVLWSFDRLIGAQRLKHMKAWSPTGLGSSAEVLSESFDLLRDSASELLNLARSEHDRLLDLDDQLAQRIGDLDSMRHSIEQRIDNLAGYTEQTSSLYGRLSAAIEQLTNEVSAARQADEMLRQGLGDLGSRAHELIEIDRELDSRLTRIAASIEAYSEQNSSTITQLRQATGALSNTAATLVAHDDMMREALGEVGEQQRTSGEILSRVSRNLERTTSTIEELMGALQRTEQRIGALAATVQQLSDALSGTFGRIDQVYSLVDNRLADMIVQIGHLVQRYEVGFQTLGDRFDAIEQRRQQQTVDLAGQLLARLTQGLGAQTAALGEALTALSTHLDQIEQRQTEAQNAQLARFDEVARRQAEALQTLAPAFRELPTAVADLAPALNTFRDASRQLGGIISAVLGGRRPTAGRWAEWAGIAGAVTLANLLAFGLLALIWRLVSP